MPIIRFILLTLAVLIISATPFAQSQEEKQKEANRKELSLLNEILHDANELTLPENRAIVYAQAGTRIWQYDQKKARQLFQTSIAELMRAQTEAETVSSGQRNIKPLIYGQTPRHQVLNLIANRDAEFALETFKQSRPKRLARLMTRFGVGRTNSFRYSGLGHFIRNELQNERRIIGLAADQNPALAKELVRKSLKDGVDNEVLNLLRKLHKADPAGASELAEETIEVLVDTEFGENANQQVNVVNQFLSVFGRETLANGQMAVSENSVRALADKLSRGWMRPEFRSLSLESVSFKAIERMFPVRAADLRQKQIKYKQLYRNQNAEHTRYSELMKSKMSGSELVRQASKFSSYRYSVFDYAFRKLAEEGNIAQIETILAKDFPPEEAVYRLSQVYTTLAYRESGQGRYSEAWTIIEKIPDENSRFHALIQLANAAYRRKPEENKQLALSVLNHADALIAETPDNQTEIRKLVALTTAFSVIDPNQAFRYFALLLPPVNKFTKSYAVVAQFRQEGAVRNGEFVIKVGMDPTGQFNLGQVLVNLKNYDFGQTVDLANRFEQPETRIALKLQMVRGLGNQQLINLPIGSGRSMEFGLRPTRRQR